MKGYYFITDDSLSRRGNFSDVKSALKAGVKIIQYRNKRAGTRQMYLEAKKLRPLCRGAFFIVNDRVDIALAVGADGVHIGSEDMSYPIVRKLLGKGKIIGMTVRTLSQAKAAERLGADYIGVSPIFPTRTKKDAGKARGVKLIRGIKKQVKIPVIAVGGISLCNAKDVIRAGADGLCAISAVVTKANVSKEIKKFQELFKS
ncbi:MAG: thiamine phosphate synthase [Candidatus Omnitrophica bacterium]|nr:thiamine phosphate synthase [Candidatus Omnitrophota bacterium]MBU1869683.1 thiamine phosphate synthase [Candidatus Omnitrophota bacterium]